MNRLMNKETDYTKCDHINGELSDKTESFINGILLLNLYIPKSSMPWLTNTET